MANRTVITGRLVADPELRNTPTGIPVTQFRIAVQRRFSKDNVADFYDVVAWRKTAEFVCKYFAKGKWIDIDGYLRTAPWEDKNQSKHQGIKIIAEYVDFVGDKPKDGLVQNHSESPSENIESAASADYDLPYDDLPF